MTRELFNDNWYFEDSINGSILAHSGANGAKWVTLPHDATIELPRKADLPNGSGCGFFQHISCRYTKTFFLDAQDADKEIGFEFEGVYHNAFVYVNGVYAGRCPYGYSSFYIDATKYLRPGAENKVVVVVRNGTPSSRWYAGSGIYRNVYLRRSERLHLSHKGVRLTTLAAEAGGAQVLAEVDVVSPSMAPAPVSLCVRLFDQNELAAENTIPFTVTEPGTKRYQVRMWVDDPRLWSPDDPHLYTYRVSLLAGDHIVDEETGHFGVRVLSLDTKRGLCINGTPVKLRGGCIHHDNGIIGSREFHHAAESRIRAMKAAGYNAVRSAHYPMSKTVLDVCDQVGMLVMDEFADVWASAKTDFDYSLYIQEWWKHDIESMVEKDYNHPSVIMYSIGNEIPETGEPLSVQFGKELADYIRSMDPHRYVTNCINMMLSVKNRMPAIMEELRQKGQANGGSVEGVEINTLMNNFGDLMRYVISTEQAGQATEEACAQVDVVGYNYADVRYEQDMEKYPHRILVGSETYPGMLDENWEMVKRYPRILGDFAWSAWDYLGEVGIGKISYGEKKGFSIYAEYPYKSAYCGDFDLIGTRRPVSYWRQSIWDPTAKPYIAVCPPDKFGQEVCMTNWCMTDAVRSWTWHGHEEHPVKVEVYSAAEEIELYVNDRLIARKPVGEFKKNMATFETVYDPGEIKVLAYFGGQPTGCDSLRTAGAPCRIQATIDRNSIPWDGSDIAYLDICLTDESDIINPQDDCKVHIALEGAGELAGFGSADPKSEENYFDTTATTYEGRLRAAIRGNGHCGKVIVKLTAENCPDAVVELISN